MKVFDIFTYHDWRDTWGEESYEKSKTFISLCVDDPTWHIYDEYAKTISLMVPKTIAIESLFATKC